MRMTKRGWKIENDNMRMMKSAYDRKWTYGVFLQFYFK